MTKILVIEDESLILENIVEILELEHYEVRSAPNGQLGLQTASEFIPDLIVCDIMMPEVNGYDVLTELHSRRETSTVPFIFLTARASRGDIRKGMTLGADDYLTKPFSAQELLEAVNARLEKKAIVADAYSQKLEELRESFILAIPHELRTPLSAVMGYSALLMEDCQALSPEDIFNMSKRINSAAGRLHHLFENYLLYAQVEILSRDPNRVANLKENHTDYPSIMVQSAAARGTGIYKREHDLSMDLVDADVQIAEDSLGKIAEELVDNALKFSKENTPVGVTTYIRDGQFCLQISDHGYGMSDESIAHIGAYIQFERKVYEQQGTGLGLILARKIAELYGGQLIVESTLGEGTTVTVLLPLMEHSRH